MGKFMWSRHRNSDSLTVALHLNQNPHLLKTHHQTPKHFLMPKYEWVSMIVICYFLSLKPKLAIISIAMNVIYTFHHDPT